VGTFPAVLAQLFVRTWAESETQTGKIKNMNYKLLDNLTTPQDYDFYGVILSPIA